MGSSGKCSNKSIDASVGGLVWVRRRNGHMWPGQILGPEELPESSSGPARSGTPVKVLGLKDMCVEWHNLENSKLVKAFRCGEYDKCIEKALLVAASASRKPTKYNRREDAILHALEIERGNPNLSLGIDKQNGVLGEGNPNLSLGIEKQNGAQNLIGESLISSHPREGSENVNGDSCKDNSSSELELSHSGVSFEGKICKVKGQQKTPIDSEDDGTEGAKRMKGLDDLGTGVMQSAKRKRSQAVSINECLKKKSRCRPLTKVLQSTIMCDELPSPAGSALDKAPNGEALVTNNKSNCAAASCENGTSFSGSEDTCGKCKQENEISGILEFAESGDSRKLFDVPFATEGSSPVVPCASQKGELSAGELSSGCGQVETNQTMPCGSGEHNESGCTILGDAEILDSRQRTGKETSKWQSKGKRNFRQSSKRLDSGNAMDMSDESNGSPLTSSIYPESSPVTKSLMDEFRGWSKNSPHKESRVNGPTADLPIPRRSLPYRLSRFVVNPKYESPDFSLRHHITDSSLCDVKVEVKSCYRTRHIPYVSLMSKLNGQSITGHRLSVEVLDDGFCDQILVKHIRLKPRPSLTKSSRSRKEGGLSKKVRKLSSLTGPHKQNREKKKPTVQKLIGSAIACVPLKVVFSRIKAALNGSIRPGHRLIAPGIS